MHERALVTGAAGFIGSHVVDRLLTLGNRVLGIDNFDPFYSREEKHSNLARALQHPEFRLVEADCCELHVLEEVLADEGFDVVVHLAAKAGVRPSLADPIGYARANVIGTQAVLELARRRGVQRFVLGSSSAVYGNNANVPFSEDDPVEQPISPYAATKRAAELLCSTYYHLYGLGVLALRFFTVYGPRQRPDLAIRKFATRMLEGRPIQLFGDGTTSRDYTWIDDIVQGVLGAIERSRYVPSAFEIINLGGNQTTTLSRLVQLLADALRIDPKLEHRAPQPGDVQCTYANIAKARELLGYSPNVSIEDGIPLFAEWIRNAASVKR